jgi:hypothetical protein
MRLALALVMIGCGVAKPGPQVLCRDGGWIELRGDCSDILAQIVNKPASSPSACGVDGILAVNADVDCKCPGLVAAPECGSPR